MDEMKTCTGPCGRELPGTLEFFHKNKQADGSEYLRSRCKDCRAGRIPDPPHVAVPDGWEMHKLTTEVDEHGRTEKQHIGARPERTVETPIIEPLQPGHAWKRVSTLVGGDGKVIQQWKIATKEEEDRQQREQWLLDAIAGLAEKWPAREPVRLEEVRSDDRLLCVIPMGDPHFGQYSWAAETGDDYDLALAEQYHCTAMDELVRSAPTAKRGLLINLGDFVHADNSSNQTLRGHHQLDVDTRWPKVIRSSVNALIWLVRRMLAKFEIVDAWMVPGNHDPHSAVMLQLALALFFKDEPRVRIDDTAGLFYYMRFGETLIGATHTHTIKDRATLGEMMAMHRKEDWGVTSHRHYYAGHVHHDSVLETRSGVLVETMRTLAGKDKFAAESGYGSGRDMKCDVFDVEDGRIQRNTIGIRQIVRQLKQGEAR